jgi:hypothetical protein
MGENLKKIASGVDISSLADAIESRPYLFSAIKARQETPGSAHGDTESIFLRWAESQTLEAVFNEIPAIDYPALEQLPEVRPILARIVDLLGTSAIGRILIVKLRPGGFITPHIDEGAYADHYERFHLVLESGIGNAFFVEFEPDHSEVAYMKPGELWWFDHKRKHWVINDSQVSRIHLIIDAVVPRFRKERDVLSA